MLERIQIVLSHTSHPGNIGAAARGMKTMGLSRLVLISPKSFPCAEATARASGADDVLSQARVVTSLSEAIGESTMVLGTSARLRRLSMPQHDARTAALEAAREAMSADAAEVSILFGREQSGLSNEEMDRCHALVHIPTDPAFSSLNLASTVQVLSYELRMAALAAGEVEGRRMADHEPASERWMDGLFEHMERALLAVRFLDPNQKATMMSRLRRLFMRARPSENEVHILRGILSAAEDAAAQDGDRKGAE